jgi:hypothetical protein
MFMGLFFLCSTFRECGMEHCHFTWHSPEIIKIVKIIDIKYSLGHSSGFCVAPDGIAGGTVPQYSSTISVICRNGA